MNQILHIFQEHKFYSFAFQSYAQSNLSISHDFFLLTDSSNKEEKIYPRTKVFNDIDELKRDLEVNIEQWDAVCLHWLTGNALIIGNMLKGKITVIPFLWGTEMYSTFEKELSKYLYMPNTEAIRNEFRLDKVNRGNTLAENLVLLKKRLLKNYRKYEMKSFLSSVKAYVPVCDEEGFKYNSKLNLKTKILDHRYIVDLSTHIENPEINQIGDNVLVGNSAAQTNNHVDIFLKLERVKGWGKIFCPLSYANAEPYASVVEERGKEIFKERFEAFRNFVTPEEYYAKIDTCRFVIMGQRRQQAGGNLMGLIAKGSTVFLYPENTFFEYYTNLGITIRCLDDLKEGANILDFDLTDDERKNNLEIIAREHSKEKLVEKNDICFQNILSF